MFCKITLQHHFDCKAGGTQNGQECFSVFIMLAICLCRNLCIYQCTVLKKDPNIVLHLYDYTLFFTAEFAIALGSLIGNLLSISVRTQIYLYIKHAGTHKDHQLLLPSQYYVLFTRPYPIYKTAFFPSTHILTFLCSTL